MNLKKLSALLLCSLMLLSSALAEGLTPLPMDDLSYGPVPKDECYLSDNEYVDESISVKIYEGRYADTDYVYAHVKISHPSQLRTIPAGVYKGVKNGSVQRNNNYNFKNSSTTRGRFVASAANAVIAINGDYFTKTECKVVLRMGTQYRNTADGLRDLLIIDKNGDLSYLNAPTISIREATEAEAEQMTCTLNLKRA